MTHLYVKHCKKGVRIYEQLRSLGSSYDWSRVRFTMDPSMCRAVNEAFIRLHDAGDIYRANRLVNWSCTLKSAISDIEVDKVEFGMLVLFAYKVEGSTEEVVVATTRVETMLGDVAVAVHPNDERWIGKRHNLPFINILDDEGKMLDNCGDFAGMKRFDVRRQIVKKLEDMKLYKSSKENPMVVPLCSRSKDIVEPMLKPQWYISCDKMAADAVTAVKTGDLKIIPDVHEKTWFHWMEGIRDWCISRQLWWGHQIPAYRLESDQELWVSAHTEEEAIKKASAKFGIPLSDVKLKRDDDVLDTWFSSALFPFSIFGWPDNTDDLKVHAPNLPSELSPMDRWMLSRLALAVQKVNAGFQSYEFPSATTHCYNLWLYDLCDVYLEYLKPVFASGTDAEKFAARRTLYTTLEFGLKLLSPFMPFVTEELYQRLPRKDKSCLSICVAPYPT
ncbi:Uncharacterized protein OBRU01_05020, partial [Operophtera brumata]